MLRIDLENTAVQLLNDYMGAWNRKDLPGLEKTFHFPHFRFARNRLQTLESAGIQNPKLVWGRVGSDWGHSEWTHLHVVHASAEKIHVDAEFARYQKDGSLKATYQSLYILTCEKGAWGIKMRSSFA